MSTRSVSPGCERPLDDRAAGVHEGEAVALELLQDEALAAEQAGAELALERDADRDPLGRAEEGVLLAQHRAAVLRRSSAMMLPGIGRGERDLLALPAPLPKTVMNSDSPVSTRLPAERSLPMKPPLAACAQPSPKMVSIWMPGSMYMKLPASAMHASPGSSVISTNCISSPNDLVVDLVRAPSRGGGGGDASVTPSAAANGWRRTRSAPSSPCPG